MAYKKYFRRNGKVFGPYYYQSYRDKNGKIKKKYFGTRNPDEDNSVNAELSEKDAKNNPSSSKSIVFNLKILIFMLIFLILIDFLFVLYYFILFYMILYELPYTKSCKLLIQMSIMKAFKHELPLHFYSFSYKIV